MGSTTEGAAPLGGRWWWAALAAAWTACTLLAWSHLHDDAATHLRFAAHVVDTGRFAVLVDAPSVGTGSPPWTMLLAQAGAWLPREHWPALAKALSAAGSAVTLVVIGALARPSASSRTHGRIAAAIVITFAAPAAVLSLQDGTELGALVAAAVLCGAAIDRWLGPGTTSERVLVLGVAAALPMVLRIDAAPIGVATLLAARALDRRAWAPAVATAAAIVLPVWAWTRISLGALVPDAIVADAGHALAWRWPAELVASAWTINPWWLVGAIGLVIVVVRRHPMRRLASLGVAPIFVALWVGALRGQPPDEAVRALLPTLAFAWSVALVVERHTGGLARRLERRRGRQLWQLGLVVGVAHLALSWPSTRARLEPPAPLPSVPEGARVFTTEVGRLSFATDAMAIDLRGRVHGRLIAQLPPRARPCALAARHGVPEFAWLDPDADVEALGLVRDGDALVLRCDETPSATYVMTEPHVGASALWRRIATLP